ncbi:MAG TPA: serine/threonine-protein kinase [Thermoanaerobaculia bacterium]|nr:serine/threonine-protein kinase [Thermoanaerobaculia bacterium]
MPAETPQRLGPYQVLAPLGRRGSIQVFEGVEAAGNRPVTIEMLQPRLAESAESVRRFQAAVEGAARLGHHPHVVQVVGRGEEDGQPFAALERFAGGPLHDVLRQRRLSLPEAMEVFKAVCRGLQHAHGRGVLHGDLNPWTVLVTPDLSELKLTDFGLGRLQPSGTLTAAISTTEITLSGFHYLAPELLEPSAKPDARADLYSAGVMFHEMLTGRAPGGKFSLPSQLNGELPSEIDVVVLKCLARRPDDRYGDAGELLAELERLEETLRLRLLSELRGITRGTTRLLGGGDESRGRGGKRTLILVVAIAVLLALLAAAGLLVS